MSTNTTNMALPKAVGTDQSNTYLKTSLAAALDTIDGHHHGADANGLAVRRVRSGVAGSRPAAGTAGAVYVATDTGKVSFDDGSNWQLGLGQGCRVYHNATQALADSTGTRILFNSERFDNNGMHSTSVNTGRITIVTPGIYVVTAQIEFDANATGVREIEINLNGDTAHCLASDTRVAVTGSQLHRCNLTTIYQFAANDYIEVWATQTSGGSLNVNASNAYQAEFSAVRIG